MRYTAAVITVSDKGARGERVDTSGPAISRMLKEEGYEVIYYNVIPDEMDVIRRELLFCADEQKIHLILTTGGTGFSPRDITPEATLAVIERETRGISTAMCTESLKITPRGCLSRGVAGIRKGSLIINLPGSEKAAKENLHAVLGAIGHGLDMLVSEGSADCGQKPVDKKVIPSMEEWIKEAKADPDAGKVGMYLTHHGIVRETPKAMVREGNDQGKIVSGMLFSYDKEKVEATINLTKSMDGIYYVRVWLNEGELQVGDDIMHVLIGGDIRPRVICALESLVEKIKTECVTETELYR